MATSIMQRCLFPRRRFIQCIDYKSVARRCLLSSAYTNATIWEQRQKEPHSLGQLAALMDRTYERKLPVSSLAIGRFIDNISSRDEVDQAEYYLYKFRHSPNCWFLRDWTVHSWIRQCLKYGARDKALYTLKNKVQFGIFPDDFTFNILIDSFIKDKDFKGACSVVEEVMLQESFEQISTQILSLHALSKYLATQPELSWQEERSIGASLLLAGLKQENSIGFSARLMGLALIGKVEFSRGIHAVFHEMPLIWSSGYLRRAVAVLQAVSSDFTGVQISEDALNFMEKILQDLSAISDGANTQNDSEMHLDEEDQLERLKLPQYISSFRELKERLQTQDKIVSRSLESLLELLPISEESDLSAYRQRMQDWGDEQQKLIQREAESREKSKRDAHTLRAAQ